MILCYRGTSLISRLIELRTWSCYSHTSWMCSNGSEFEAWPGKGVVHAAMWGENHTPVTQIDCFDFVQPLSPDEIQDMEAYLIMQVGKHYDYSGVFGFLPIARLFGLHNNSKAFFCSELIAAATQYINRPLSRKATWRIDPDDVAMSPVLKFVKTIKVRDDSLQIALA